MKLVLFPVCMDCEILFPRLDPAKLRYADWPDYNIEKDDLILFAGGTDVNPKLYGEKHGTWTSRPDLQRDAFERSIFELYPDNPKLGICRGAQFLNVMNGGKLIQDVTGHAIGATHPMHTIDGRVIPVTSTHHQMMCPISTGELLAWAYGRSTHYMDGNNEDVGRNFLGVGKRDVVMEPEIVFYPNTKSLCIQGHPEYLFPKHEFWKYTCELAYQYLGVKS